MRGPLIIRDTRKYGRGVFAARPIRKGEIIHVLSGETVDVRDLVRRLNAGAENIDDPLQVGMRTYIDLDRISRTFNHSCSPNAAIRKRSELFAIEDIPKGAEVTFDYSLTVAPTDWKMRCDCRAPDCRRMLGDVLSIPRARLERYQRLGAVQDYMKKLLARIRREGAYQMPLYEIASLRHVQRTSNV